VKVRLQTKRTAEPKPLVAHTGSQLLLRECACGGTPDLTGECAGCSKKRLRRRAAQLVTPSAVPPIVHEALDSPGQFLDPATHALMELCFELDFRRIRVHDDAKSTESSRAGNAKACTVGRDVVFGAGRYARTTNEGRRSLAHGLTHVIQQGENTPQPASHLGMPHPVGASEQRAESTVQAVFGSRAFTGTPDTIRTACLALGLQGRTEKAVPRLVNGVSRQGKSEVRGDNVIQDSEAQGSQNRWRWETRAATWAARSEQMAEDGSHGGRMS
jgi:hypothetical protein